MDTPKTLPKPQTPHSHPLTTANFTNWDQHLKYWLPSGPGGTGGLQMPLHTQVTGLSLGRHWNLFFPETCLSWDGELAPGPALRLLSW